MAMAFGAIAASHTVGMLYVYAVIYGFSGAGILLASINAESLGAITGAIIFANNIGGALGPTLAGYIFDARDSYQLAFVLCIVTAAASGVIIWMLKPASNH